MRLLAIPMIFLSVSACAAETGGITLSGEGANLPGAGGAADAPVGSLGGEEECDAAEYRPLIGTPHSDADLPDGPRLRVYSDSALVTQEYLPNRTNIVFGTDNGVILRVFCG